MEKRYCVKFIRCDGAVPPVEEYYYANKEDAETHFSMFKDDSDPDFKEMYERIQLIVMINSLSSVMEEIHFK